MIITIDVGNTNIDFGFFDDDDAFQFRDRIPTARLEELTDLWLRLKDSEVVSSVELVLIASVRPSIDPNLVAMMKKVFKVTPKRAGYDFAIPITARVDEPPRVGIDRLVNSWEAFRRVRGPALVVSFGTAMVVDAVDAHGDFVGGAIAPGLRIQALALHEKCQQLPLIDPAPYVDPVGKNTAHAMSVGMFHGQVGAARHLLRQIGEAVGGAPRLLATGGDAARFAPFLPEIHEVVPNLTLEGVLHAYRASRGKGDK
jgi:type III pantothenate kinase